MSFIVIFYVLRYQGDIYILSALDRETKDRYTLTAYARDNPGGSLNNRRENSVQVHGICGCGSLLFFLAHFIMSKIIWRTLVYNYDFQTQK